MKHVWCDNGTVSTVHDTVIMNMFDVFVIALYWLVVVILIRQTS